MQGLHIGTVLFAVDPSAHTAAVESVVARIAILTGADVILLGVFDGDLSASRSMGELDGVTERLRTAGVTARLEWRAAEMHDVPATIAAAANELEADLIAVGSRGRSDIRGLFLGSVSHRVIAGSDRPVLVVSDRVREGGASIQRILLAVSGGEEVPHAVEATAELARVSGARVRVLHARHLLPDDHRLYTETDDDSNQVVQDVVHRLARSGVAAEGRSRLINPDAAGEIVAAADAWEADLIVIGSRRLSELASLVLAATTDSVLRISPIPVLVAERTEPPARR